MGLVMAALKPLKEECLKNSLASQFGPPLPGALTDARITEYYSQGSLWYYPAPWFKITLALSRTDHGKVSVSQTFWPCHLSHPLFTHWGKQRQQNSLIRVYSSFLRQRHWKTKVKLPSQERKIHAWQNVSRLRGKWQRQGWCAEHVWECSGKE